jgi:hypothetical protein
MIQYRNKQPHPDVATPISFTLEALGDASTIEIYRDQSIALKPGFLFQYCVFSTKLFHCDP